MLIRTFVIAEQTDVRRRMEAVLVLDHASYPGRRDDIGLAGLTASATCTRVEAVSGGLIAVMSPGEAGPRGAETR